MTSKYFLLIILKLENIANFYKESLIQKSFVYMYENYKWILNLMNKSTKQKLFVLELNMARAAPFVSVIL